MQISFLGTGGGRFVTITQLRATGGWILEMDGQKISVDPGPGAVTKARDFGISLKGLTGVVISHCHPDHYTDAEVMIEAMTEGTTKKKGVLVSNQYVIKGGDGFNQRISDYHLKALDRYEILEPNQKTAVGDIEIIATRAKHTEPKTIGFVFKGTKTLGYVSDTEYFPELEEQFKGCDYLVLNCLRPRKVDWPKHLNSEGASKIISYVNPESAIITHFGMHMLRAGPEKEAEWIEEKTGVETVAAHDGMIVNFDKGEKAETLGKFLKNNNE